MSDASERNRAIRDERRIADSRESPAGQTIVGRVVSTTVTANKFFRVRPTAPFGLEMEGGTGTFADSLKDLVVLMLGSKVPSQNDYIVCRFVDYRWVTQGKKSGGGTGTGIIVPNCFCPIPTTIKMISNFPACNYRMYRNCTLQYGPPPPPMQAAGFTQNVWTSTEYFIDDLTGKTFFYHFTCTLNQFNIDIWTLNFASPGNTNVSPKVYRWIVGNTFNTCSPFSMTVGESFNGSDTNCDVDLDGTVTQIPPSTTVPAPNPPTNTSGPAPTTSPPAGG